MPLVDLEQHGLFPGLDAPKVPVTPDEEAAAEANNPSLTETFAASFRTQNEIGSLLAKEDIPDPVRVEDGFDAYNYNKGTVYEGDSAFLDVHNRKAADAVRRQIDRENEDRRTVAASGLTGVVSDVATGTMSPTLLLPGGALYRSVKGGYAVGRSALAAGAAALGAAAVQEAGLQATQETRTARETGFTLGASALLGGFIGGGVAAALTRTERVAAERAVSHLTSEIVNPFGASGGAAAVSDIGVGDLDIAGRAAGAVANTTAQLNPVLRLNTSPAQSVRLYGQQLGENSLYQAGNEMGVTAGPSVERLAKQTFESRIYRAERGLADDYAAMRKAGGTMTRAQFEEAVGRAARRGDQGEDEFVSRAAGRYRSEILDPYKHEAIAVELLPENVKTDTADSYLHRMWDFQKLTAGETRFKDIVKGWASENAQVEVARLQESATRRTARIDQEIGDLKMSPEERRLNLWHIDAALKDGNLSPSEVSRLKLERRRIRFNIAGSSDEISRLNQRLVETDEDNIGRLRRMSAGIRNIEQRIDRLDPDDYAKAISDLNEQFNEILGRSNAAADRVAKFLERTSGTDVGDRLVREEAAEARRVTDMNKIAARLEDMDSIDQAEAIRELQKLIDERLEETLSRVTRANEQVMRVKERIEKLNPEKLTKRVADLEARKADISVRLNDRINLKLDAGNAFEDYAKEVADLVYDKLTGRANDGSLGSLSITMGPRGPLKERTFNIPDALVEDFLNNNIVEVGRRYARTMSADVELTKRFGAIDLKDQRAKVADEYRALREQVASADSLDQIREITGKGYKVEGLREKAGIGRSIERQRELALDYLAAREKSDLGDLDGLRDLIRGNYGNNNPDALWSRISRAASQFNYLRLMGGAVVASLGDIYRPAMVHGLMPFLQDGIKPLLSGAGRAARGMSIEEARRFGLVVERYTQGRLATFAEIGDPYKRGTSVERLLENGTRIGSRWNGILLWTDAMKGISSVMSQNRIVRGIKGEEDTRFLAYLGINPAMRARIKTQIDAHAEEVDGIWVANSDRWSDAEAVRHYGAALGKDVDSIITTKSVGDVPLFANTPTGRLLLQFKSFALASHQKVLLRGLQESPARFVSGMVGMSTLGMLAAYARAWRGGEERMKRFSEAASNPGYLVGEALDLTGIFAVPMEAANTFEKVAGVNPVKDPLKAMFPEQSQRGSSLRFQSRGVASTFLGPSAGLIDVASEVAKLSAMAASGEATDKQKKRLADQAVQLVPFYSYPGMREMVNVMRGDR